MAQTITNQASLSYQVGAVTSSVRSNIATATVSQALRVTKTPLNEEYRAAGTVTYVVSLTNGGSSALSDITVTDTLGTYETGGGTAVTPLTIDGDALLLTDGAVTGRLTPAAGEESVSFTIPALAAGSDAQLIYSAQVNETAPLAPGSTIVNTVTAEAAGLTDPVTATAAINVAEYADVAVVKTMSPAELSDGDPLTYTFTLTNSGNTEATQLTLTDAFDPAPASITVTVDGTARASTEYTYEGGVLTFPSETGTPISLPAAEITQDETTGVVTVVPAAVTVTVVGTF